MSRKEKKMKKARYISAASALLLIVLCLCACGEAKKEVLQVKVADYTKVSVYGFDHEGEITECKMDEEGLTQAIGGSEKISEVLAKLNGDEKYKDPEGEYTETDLFHYFAPDYPKDTNLSNEDVVLISLVPTDPFEKEETNAAFYDMLGVEFVPARLRIKGLLCEIDSKDQIGSACIDSLTEYCKKVFATSWMSKIEIGDIYFCSLKEGCSSEYPHLILFAESYDLHGSNARQYEGVVALGWHSEDVRYAFSVLELLEYKTKEGESVTLLTPGYGINKQIERLSPAYDIQKIEK